MQIKRPKEFNEIKVVTAAPASNIPFCDLLEQPTSAYLKDRMLMKQIRKIFADGISLPDPVEETKKRRDAYCLTLGITKQFIEEYQRPLYQGLLQVSTQRQRDHTQRMD